MAAKKFSYYIYKTHAWLGLIVGIFFLMMGLSGSVLVFAEEIDHLYAPAVADAEAAPKNVDAAIANAIGQYPDWEIRIRNVLANGEPLELDLRRPAERKLLFVHPYSGEILKEYKANALPHNWLLKLHYSLHAGLFGRITIFVVGILLLISLITGFIVFRKSIWKVLTFRQTIKFNSKRNFYSSAHRVIGTWGLLTTIILVVSGLFISYDVVVNGIRISKGVVPPVTPQVEISVNNTRQQLENQYPGLAVSYIRLPKQPGGAVTFYGHRDTDFFLYSEYSNYIGIDAISGEEVYSSFAQEKGAYGKWEAMILPLHFGNFGGIIVKIIYCIAGLIPAVLAISGFLLWLARSQSGNKRKTIPSTTRLENVKA